MQDNLVSIIMPAYNSANYIKDSIESVLRQSYPYWELLVIDDGSSDNTAEIVKAYNDKRIVYLHQPNQGVAAARNYGLAEAKGRFIAFLDSDDIWLSEKLSSQLAFMQSQDIGFSYTEYCQFWDNPAETGELIKIQDSVDYHELLKGNDIGCLTVMLDKCKCQIPYMPADRHEDYITWLNIMKSGMRAFGLHEDLARYRKSSNSLSGNKWKSLQWTWQVYRKSQRLSILKSIYYFVYYIVRGIKKHFC